ncbi:olfactory receptor 4C6-like [Bufo gargarizans]|uniref:olfactory receptor 4C6-like n=1 Tax=Bufo gargarizans TaxID=30331 RepID=UPI001CF218E4|nr:olfactory receptor 4C6-like [Bufo gargarizans]
MENDFNISKNLVLLGLMEMEGLKYLYCVLSIFLYSFILLLSIVIVFVVFTDTRLHEPMYILICNLALNGIFGSSLFFPKLIVDLITSSTSISHGNCAVQALCMALFAIYEMSTFNLMALDRYLAICHPLHYGLVITNERVINLVTGSFLVAFILVLTAVLLTWKLPLCGNRIDNIFCDNMSMIVLSCVDSSISQLYSASVVITYLCVTIFVTVFSNLQILIVCLKLSRESRQKAVHTLVTHLLNFFTFLVGFLFIFIRYRLGSVKLPVIIHVLLSATALIVPPLFNPLIYGVRTHALKTRIVQYVQWLKWTKTHMQSRPISVISYNQSQ